jgi:hypothetical protein
MALHYVVGHLLPLGTEKSSTTGTDHGRVTLGINNASDILSQSDTSSAIVIRRLRPFFRLLVINFMTF